MPGKSTFGSVRRLPSGRYQARYTGPDGRVHRAPVTFDAKGDADGWLATQRADVVRGVWRPPAEVRAETPGHGRGPVSLTDYAAAWLATRKLAPRTRGDYRRMLDTLILPDLGERAVADLTPAAVRAWHAALGERTGPSHRAHAYALLRSILATAVEDDVIPANPCRIRGAGSVRRVHTVRPATLAELAAAVEATPERFRVMVLLAAWCGLRFGELVELRRGDVEPDGSVVRVRRGASRVPGGVRHVAGPKTAAGVRDVAVPPHLAGAVRAHLAEHVRGSDAALLFPGTRGGHLAPSTAYGWWYPAREAAGRPDLRFHDLRHTGAVLAAATGATIAELMARLGHSTPQAAMIYQHAAADRDRVIADALSDLAAGASVVPLRSVGGSGPR